MENQTPQIQSALQSLMFSALSQDQKTQVLKTQLEMIKNQISQLETQKKSLILSHKACSDQIQQNTIMEQIHKTLEMIEQLISAKVKIATILFFTPIS
jgi:hypothetical protein